MDVEQLASVARHRQKVQIHPNAVLCCFKYMAATIGIEILFLPKALVTTGYLPAIAFILLLIAVSPLLVIFQRILSEHYGQPDYLGTVQAVMPGTNWKKPIAIVYLFERAFANAGYLWVMRELTMSFLPCNLVELDKQGIMTLAILMVVLFLIEMAKRFLKKCTKSTTSTSQIPNTYQTHIQRCNIENFSISSGVHEEKDAIDTESRPADVSPTIPLKMDTSENEGASKLMKFDAATLVFVCCVISLVIFTILEYVGYKHSGQESDYDNNHTCPGNATANQTAHTANATTGVWVANATSNITVQTRTLLEFGWIPQATLPAAAFIYAFVGYTTMLGVCDTVKSVPMREFFWKIYLSCFTTTVLEIGICTVVYLQYADTTALIFPLSFRHNAVGLLAKIASIGLCFVSVSSRLMPSCCMISSKLFGNDSSYNNVPTFTAVVLMLLSFAVTAFAGITLILGVGCLLCAVLQIGIPLIAFVIYATEYCDIRAKVTGLYRRILGAAYQEVTQPLIPNGDANTAGPTED